MPQNQSHQPELTLSSEDTLPADIRPINKLRGSLPVAEDTIDRAMAAVAPTQTTHEPAWQHYQHCSIGLFDGMEMRVWKFDGAWQWEVKLDGNVLYASMRLRAGVQTPQAARWLAENHAELVRLHWRATHAKRK